MNKEDHNFELECDAIRRERSTYAGGGIRSENIKKFFDYLSCIFLCMGFVSLVLIFFSETTLLHATCFFVISYTLELSGADRAELALKGATEDLAHIRASLAVLRKK
ncbi:MAG: hypothetical protein PSY14_15890 [bacterium]|nr:hypothetical protein [bacterium]